MASGGKHGSGGARRISSEQTGEESSESDGETEPAKSFHRRLSTNREIKCSVSFNYNIYFLYRSRFCRCECYPQDLKEAWHLFTHALLISADILYFKINLRWYIL
ncbi:hypothetical protein L9F63_020537 [Diploptera punctata]|uniref:Uncharacterized protein n=1 Tax=Diploptera punctata TaxID=6984 RepID=A0AAD8ECW2_DIPPU|nr:hypothetical protein L9F63_020537 [Diploptera punctata]